MSYPQVLDEFTTLRKLHEGFSIARFGDGEFKLIDGAAQVREPANPKLASELRRTLRHPHEKCLIGIPTMNPEGPKYKSWIRHERRFAHLLRKTHGPFYSAFISRPDSAPWIRTPEYARLFEKLWAWKRTAVVCTPDNSALRAIGAFATWHIECRYSLAYETIDHLERTIVKSKPDIAILSIGPTATCLANRLARAGIQAIDFGSGGAFIARLLA